MCSSVDFFLSLARWPRQPPKFLISFAIVRCEVPRARDSCSESPRVFKKLDWWLLRLSSCASHHPPPPSGARIRHRASQFAPRTSGIVWGRARGSLSSPKDPSRYIKESDKDPHKGPKGLIIVGPPKTGNSEKSTPLRQTSVCIVVLLISLHRWCVPVCAGVCTVQKCGQK